MRRLFLSVLVLASLTVGVQSCKKGDTGPAGPAGPSGTQGTDGADGAAGPTGATGKDGTQLITGTGNPGDAVGKTNDFYIDRTSKTLWGPKKSDGSWADAEKLVLGGSTSGTGCGTVENVQDGATGPTGNTGKDGAPGKDGTNFLAGSGAPANSLGKKGDVYFDITNSTIYGPKTADASGWGEGVSIGVNATNRTFFLDISLDGKKAAGTKVSTFIDTTLVVDKGSVVSSAYKMHDYDVQQILGSGTVSEPYAGWWDANGREIMFIDEALNQDQLYMIPVDVNDLQNTRGATFIYTRDPKNQAFIEGLRKIGAATVGIGNYITNPFWHNAATPGATGSYTGTSFPHIYPSPSIPAEFSGIGYDQTLPAAPGEPKTINPATAGGGLRYGREAAQYDLNNVNTNVPRPQRIYTMSDELYDFLTQDQAKSNGTYNRLCTWMYAEAFNANKGGRQAVTGDYLSYYPFWKKADKVNTGDNWDYTLRKQINLNTGKIKYDLGAWQNLAGTALSSLGAAWTHTRDSGSVDLSLTFLAPDGKKATAADILGITRMTSTGNNVDQLNSVTQTNYNTLYRQITPFRTFNDYVDPWVATSTQSQTTPVPGNITSATDPMWIQSFYNTWISLNNAGAWNTASNGTGMGNGSGPINDYGKNNADGGAYDLTPPTYTFNHWTHINGKLAYTNTSSAYGTVNVPAPDVDADYPWGGIVIRNGIIYVNYFIGNGGSIIRGTTQFTNSQYMHYQDATSGTAVPYAYSFLIPKGYYADSWAKTSYTDGPWPSNQNKACEGYYYKGDFIPYAPERKDVLIRLKIQTQPSASYDGIRAGANKNGIK